MMDIEVGVFGATGYTGIELIGLLERHPHVNLHFATSEGMAGKNLRQSFRCAPDVTLVSAAEAPLGQVDYVFICLPHTHAAPIVARALHNGLGVIDLSADLRLDDPAIYEHWYGVAHPSPELLPVPYGLPEIARHEIMISRSVANPGCYATAILLGLIPLVRQNLVQSGGQIIIDAKSGVTGAGRKPQQHLLFTEVDGNLSPYNIGRNHRHLAEIEQLLAKEKAHVGKLVFSPHLLPIDRGILAAIYVPMTELALAEQAFHTMYDDEPFIDVLPPGELATLSHVVRTPRAVISLTPATESLLIVMVAIDNLLKGAASQAVQNFNLMAGLPETIGLLPIEEVMA
jgi:N-acetyl-gamma-glutamyl-phosphate reductase